MSNTLSPQLLSQIFSQNSNDPFLALLTLSHPSFAQDIRLVNNTKDIVSRGNTYIAYPFKLVLPADDGETIRMFTVEMDNVSTELIDEIRSITTQMNMKLELILASIPDVVQMSQEELTVASIVYNKQRITAKVVMDGFLNTAMTSERYNPTNYPGLFG